MGFETIRGSSSRGGQEALQSMISCIRSKRSVAVTPDGPRGPRHSVRPGIYFATLVTERAQVRVKVVRLQ